MLAGETTVSIFFKLLNFAVLIGLFVYLIKRYFWHVVKDQLAAQEGIVLDLKQQKEQLRVDQRTLDHAMANQKALALELDAKIALWRVAFEKKIDQEKQNRENHHLLLIKKVEIQNQHVALKALQQQIIPKALE